MAEKQVNPPQNLATPRLVSAQASDAPPLPVQATVQLRRSDAGQNAAQFFWAVIRNRTIDFNQYKAYIDAVMCCACDPIEGREQYKKAEKLDLRLPFPGVRAYNLLKLATELYLMQECGVACFKSKTPCQGSFDGHPLSPRAQFDERFSAPDEALRMGRTDAPATSEQLLTDLKDQYLKKLEGEAGGNIDGVLPYFKVIREKLQDIPLKAKDATPDNCYGILRSKLSDPCLLELIWSYWHEEGMLVQTMNAIIRRFQNLRSRTALDPLATLEIDPLRGLNNLLWGYVQDEQHRLTIMRRAYEYDHHYGFRLVGKAVPELRPADTRSKFLEAFHQLLHTCTIFFQQDDDTTVIADGFPVLNALREVHLILAEGAHNQFGDLPSTSRQEMLIEMWILSRPEIREFLRGRIMVPYPEPWMDAVDHMKTLQKWNDTSIREFRDLGVFGEQLLVSIRYDNWSVYNDANIAATWARYWRQEIQRYIHSYRAVTGVDLTQEPVNSTVPSVLLQRRTAPQVAATR
jgi:hypothetical protein